MTKIVRHFAAESGFADEDPSIGTQGRQIDKGGSNKPTVAAGIADVLIVVMMCVSGIAGW